MKYEEVKEQSEEILKQIILYIIKTGISDDECEHLLMELAATITTCACIGENLEESEKLFCTNIGWLITAVNEGIHGYFEGTVDFTVIE